MAARVPDAFFVRDHLAGAQRVSRVPYKLPLGKGKHFAEGGLSMNQPILLQPHPFYVYARPLPALPFLKNQNLSSRLGEEVG